VQSACRAIIRTAPRNRTSSRRELQRLSGETPTPANAALTRLVAAGLMALTPPDVYEFTDAEREASDALIEDVLGLEPPPAPAPTSTWRVRVALRGAGMIHVVSSTCPEVRFERGKLADVAWTPVASGDTVGHIDWSEVVAVTWREGT